MTLDCDDSCVEIYIKRHGMVIEGDFVLGDFARTLERRAIAAEARVKEQEAANAELIERLQERVESYLAASSRDVQTVQQQAVEIDRLRAALHLRPIAEAGPVPEGMVRLYANRIPLGSPGAEFWSAFSEPGEEDTDYIDIYPPQQ